MQKKVSIIGTGALGSVLAKAFSLHGVPVAGLYNRSERSFLALTKDIQVSETGPFPTSVEELGEVIFITVPDSNIKPVAERLALLSDDFGDRMVVHCSGTESSKSLSALQQKGASVTSFHPMQTFTETSAASDLEGIWFDIEGDRDAVIMLKKLAEKWNSKCLEINPEAKPYLHAAAVMSSNYLIALLRLSSTIAEFGGIKETEARNALLPLLQTSLNNISGADSLSDALSGPIVRGDISTVQHHLQLLEQNPEVLALYKQLGSVVLELAESGNAVTDETVTKLSKLLQS